MQDAPFTDHPRPSSSGRDVGITLAIAILISLVIVICTVTFFYVRRRRMQRSTGMVPAPFKRWKASSQKLMEIAVGPILGKSLRNVNGRLKHLNKNKKCLMEDDLFR